MIFAPMTIIYGELHSSCLVEVPDKLRWSDVGSGQSPMLSLWAHVELTGMLGLLAERRFGHLGRYWRQDTWRDLNMRRKSTTTIVISFYF